MRAAGWDREGTRTASRGEGPLRTLLFNGSPRPLGETARCLSLLRQALPGEKDVVEAYASGVSPCVDCRYCWEHPGCAIRDGWQRIDGLLRRADAVVIASPIYFSELTGPLLSLLSRVQTYWCARTLRGEDPLPGRKRGGVLLVGGGDGSPDRAAATARTLLHQMGATRIAPPVVFHDTNLRSALEDPETRKAIRRLAAFLAEGAEDR